MAERPFKVGDKVRVIAENPIYNWGDVERFDEGIVRSLNWRGHVDVIVVDFPAQPDWKGHDHEFELVEDPFWKDAPEGAAYYSTECGGFYIHENKKDYFWKGAWETFIDPEVSFKYFMGLGMKIRHPNKIDVQPPEQPKPKKKVGWW